MLVLNSDRTDIYIEELAEDNGILHWDYAKSPEFVLLIHCDYGEQLDLARFISAVNKSDRPLVEDDILYLRDGKSCKLIRNVQNRRAYNAQDTPATYYVFGCNLIDGDYVVYEDREMSACSCSIPARIAYMIKTVRETRKVRSFMRSHVEECEFIKLNVNCDNYRDGALCYSFDEGPYVFSISSQDLNNNIYIKKLNGKMPRFFSGVSGYTVYKSSR